MTKWERYLSGAINAAIVDLVYNLPRGEVIADLRITLEDFSKAKHKPRHNYPFDEMAVGYGFTVPQSELMKLSRAINIFNCSNDEDTCLRWVRRDDDTILCQRIR